MNRFLAACAAMAVLACGARATDTKSWIQNEHSDFDKGKLTGLALRSDGRLMLAPLFQELHDPGAPYLWAVALDSKGVIYTAGSGASAGSARVFVTDAAGRNSKVLAEVPGAEIYALAVNGKDELFAATSPDGKVYRFGAGGKPEVFYSPNTKYIWAMAFSPKGDLYVATGDQGEIHRVAPDGKGSVFFRTEETHARALVVEAASGNVIAGTDPGGLIVRISPAGEGFVLYQAAKREVTALAVSKDGVIYAAAAGNKGSAAPSAGATLSLPIPPIPLPGAAAGAPRPTPSPAPAPPLAGRESGPAGGSEIYRIDRDNDPKRIWSHSSDIVYTLALDRDGLPVAGTGNRGAIFRIDSDSRHTLLVKSTSSQITSLAAAPGGRFYAVTGNIGKLYRLGPELEKKGTLESDVFDTGTFSRWGRVDLRVEANGGKASVETRSGNLDRPQKNWSPWAAVNMTGDSRASSPAARFLQYRLTLETAASGKSPELTQVEVAYLPKNNRPTIEEIEITPANYRFAPPTLSLSPSNNITLPAMGQKRRAPAILDTSGSQSMNYAKGHTGARWSAADPNGDDLLFTVEIRGEGEIEWKPLKDKTKDKFVSWDTTAFPDGYYRVRVIASDSPDNPLGEALTAQLESDRFLIDNSAPRIEGLSATRTGERLTARWKARDSMSILTKAEIAVNGADWSTVEPVGRLSDSKELDYSVQLEGIKGSEATVAVRVTDEFDNQTVEKTVVR